MEPATAVADMPRNFLRDIAISLPPFIMMIYDFDAAFLPSGNAVSISQVINTASFRLLKGQKPLSFESVDLAALYLSLRVTHRMCVCGSFRITGYRANNCSVVLLLYLLNS